MNKYEDTRFIAIDGKKFCMYCGKPMEHTRRYYERDFDEFYYCTCEDAQTEASINAKIRQLEQDIETCKRNLPKPKYGTITKLQKLEN